MMVGRVWCAAALLGVAGGFWFIGVLKEHIVN